MDTNLNSGHITVSTALTSLAEGFKLAFSKECRPYVLIPILINIILLSLAGWAAFRFITGYIFSWIDALPSFLAFLAYLLSFIAAALIIFLSCYFFSTVATIIASPFYGLLADRAEMAIHGQQSEDSGFAGVIKDIPRCLKRELRKQLWYLPLVLLCVVIMLIPVINVISPVAWFILNSFMGCLQYTDYAYDNHKVPFAQMKGDAMRHAFPSFAFGACIAVLLAVPLVNLFVPPAAVCAGTRYYVLLRDERAAAAVQEV